MTRNRDAMTLLDMARLCVTSGTMIVVAMLLLGTMMIYQKPQGGLILAETPQHAPNVEAALETPMQVATAVAARPAS